VNNGFFRFLERSRGSLRSRIRGLLKRMRKVVQKKIENNFGIVLVKM
jgi:hypothetical protein